jgi:excisionase family DNA binding protein
MIKHRDVLTTGQVAKICNVAPRTVSKWFDSGQLRGYRIPGSKDRRIPLSQLIRFMRAHNIPTDELETGQTHILIVDGDPVLTDMLKEFLEADSSYRVSTATSAFEAGMLVGSAPPDVILVDVTLPDVVPQQIRRALRGHEELRYTRLIATSGAITEGQGQMLLQDGFDHYLRKPFEVRRLIELLEESFVSQ